MKYISSQTHRNKENGGCWEGGKFCLMNKKFQLCKMKGSRNLLYNIVPRVTNLKF